MSTLSTYEQPKVEPQISRYMVAERGEQKMKLSLQATVAELEQLQSDLTAAGYVVR